MTEKGIPISISWCQASF